MVSKFSKYSYLFEREGKFFLYAPLSNSFAEIDKETYDCLLSVQKGLICTHNMDDEVKKLLRKMKVVDVDDELEINKLKANHLLHRFNPRHLYLTINPTLACNFACPYCFEASHPADFMTDEVGNAIIAFIQQRVHVTQLHVNWFGGEPLLAFNRIITLSKRMQNLGLKYNAGMITNGYLLTPDKAKLFEELQISSIQITIDGSEHTHNARRFLKGGGPTYQTILKNIEETCKCSPRTFISVRVNIDKTNGDEFFEVLSYFREYAEKISECLRQSRICKRLIGKRQKSLPLRQRSNGRLFAKGLLPTSLLRPIPLSGQPRSRLCGTEPQCHCNRSLGRIVQMLERCRQSRSQLWECGRKLEPRRCPL